MIIIYTTFIGKCHYPVPGVIPGRDLVQHAVSRAMRAGSNPCYAEPDDPFEKKKPRWQ